MALTHEPTSEGRRAGVGFFVTNELLPLYIRGGKSVVMEK